MLGSLTSACFTKSADGGKVRSSSRYASMVGSVAMVRKPPCSANRWVDAGLDGSLPSTAARTARNADLPLQHPEAAQPDRVEQGRRFVHPAAGLEGSQVGARRAGLPRVAGRVDQPVNSVGAQEI